MGTFSIEPGAKVGGRLVESDGPAGRDGGSRGAGGLGSLVVAFGAAGGFAVGIDGCVVAATREGLWPVEAWPLAVLAAVAGPTRTDPGRGRAEVTGIGTISTLTETAAAVAITMIVIFRRANRRNAATTDPSAARPSTPGCRSSLSNDRLARASKLSAALEDTPKLWATIA